jgi:hypothetical protein
MCQLCKISENKRILDLANMAHESVKETLPSEEIERRVDVMKRA